MAGAQRQHISRVPRTLLPDATITGSDEVAYDNTASGLTADDVEAAIDEIALPSVTGAYVQVLFAATPYAVLATDYVIGVNPVGGAVEIDLPAIAGAGRRLIVKDDAGTATALLTITIDGNAAETIDGAATRVLNGAYQGVELFDNGTEWVVVA